MVTLNQGAPTAHDDAGDGVSIGTEDARQGMTTGYMRRVLHISIFLTVLAMLAAWLWIDRPKTMVPDTAHNAARVSGGASEYGGVLAPQDLKAAPSAPTAHVTPQADQPQPQN